MSGFYSPTNHEANVNWTNPAKAYNDDPVDGATTQTPGDALVMTHAGLEDCDYISIRAADMLSQPYGLYNPSVDIDVWDGDSWIDVYSGSITKETLVKKAIPGGRITASKVRVAFNSIRMVGILYEVYLGTSPLQIAPPGPYPLADEMGVRNKENLYWSNLAPLADEYNIYLGTDTPPTNIVNGANQAATEGENSYDPAAPFKYATKHYWRIDAVNDVATVAGEVMSFTVEVGMYKLCGSAANQTQLEGAGSASTALEGAGSASTALEGAGSASTALEAAAANLPQLAGAATILKCN